MRSDNISTLRGQLNVGRRKIVSPWPVECWSALECQVDCLMTILGEKLIELEAAAAAEEETAERSKTP